MNLMMLTRVAQGKLPQTGTTPPWLEFGEYTFAETVRLVVSVGCCWLTSVVALTCDCRLPAH